MRDRFEDIEPEDIDNNSRTDENDYWDTQTAPCDTEDDDQRIDVDDDSDSPAYDLRIF